MDEEDSRAYIADIRRDLREAIARDDYGATSRQAERLLRQRDERGFMAHVTAILFQAPIGEIPKAWRILRAGLIPHWGADLDWRADPQHSTLLADCAKFNRPRSALALIHAGADVHLAGPDGVTALELLRRGASQAAKWNHNPLDHQLCLAAAGFGAALKEREILAEATMGAPELALRAGVPKARRL